MKVQFVSLVSALVLGLSSVAQANSVQDAQYLKSTVQRAKQVVDGALSGVGGGSRPTPSPTPFPSPTPGPVTGPWEVSDELVLEDDFVAIPLYTEASNDLFDAGSLADRAIISLQSGQIQDGVFLYAQACASMGISRSKISRANLSATQPPLGRLAAFGPQLAAVVTELNALNARCR